VESFLIVPVNVGQLDGGNEFHLALAALAALALFIGFGRFVFLAARERRYGFSPLSAFGGLPPRRLEAGFSEVLSPAAPPVSAACFSAAFGSASRLPAALIPRLLRA
jgi:hypothetical protein